MLRTPAPPTCVYLKTDNTFSIRSCCDFCLYVRVLDTRCDLLEWSLVAVRSNSKSAPFYQVLRPTCKPVDGITIISISSVVSKSGYVLSSDTVFREKKTGDNFHLVKCVTPPEHKNNTTIALRVTDTMCINNYDEFVTASGEQLTNFLVRPRGSIF